MAYVPLWCKSNYSFLEGASHPEELIEQAHAFGLSAIQIVVAGFEPASGAFSPSAAAAAPRAPPSSPGANCAITPRA